MQGQELEAKDTDPVFPQVESDTVQGAGTVAFSLPDSDQPLSSEELIEGEDQPTLSQTLQAVHKCTALLIQ